MVAQTQRRRRKKKAAEPQSRGLTPKQVAASSPPATVEHLRETIAADGGTVLGAYRDPLGGNWQILAALPLDRVEPTPYQREDRKSTRLNSSHGYISYAVFCLKKKKTKKQNNATHTKVQH